MWLLRRRGSLVTPRSETSTEARLTLEAAGYLVVPPEAVATLRGYLADSVHGHDLLAGYMGGLLARFDPHDPRED
jgi:hypothetical protein